jgi:peptide subunit release factor RF-3
MQTLIQENELELAKQIGKRHTFAIISHSGAGKMTLTVKLLLIHQY